MISGINQSNSNVGGDQVGGDKITNNYNIEITKELSPAINPIRTYGITADNDPRNTVLIRKLRDGEFNKPTIDHAIRCKANYLIEQIKLCNSEQGKIFLNDIQANLLMIINTRYIANMNEGETLRASLADMVSDFSRIVEKYKGVITIDEAFIEGMLYYITSECAINWRIEGFDDEDQENDS